MTFLFERLGEHVAFSNGKSSPERDDDALFPVFGSNGQIGFCGKVNAPENTCVIGRVGSYCGSIHFSKSACWVTDNAIKATAIIPEESRFWFYAMGNYNLHSLRAGSGQPLINQTSLKAVELPVPDSVSRRKIASLLGALDDKIELNRRMSATLEEMARALYRSWFVDFDPVHARALGQSPAHMDPTTAALFPDSFGPDGLPKGWARQPLAKHVTATRGLSYKGKHLCGPGDGVPLHNLNSIYEGGGYKDEGAKYYDGDFRPRHVIRPGDLIVANTEQSFGLELIGHAALVPSWLGPSGIFSQHIYKVEVKENSPLSKEWLYLGLSIASLGVEIRGFSNGTTVNMLPADAFEIPETSIPSAAIVEKMNEIVRPAFAQQERFRRESRTLAALRDTLLPRLMSGELRIREAEQQVEEVV
jgi:type I restriction enzyme S subunit